MKKYKRPTLVRPCENSPPVATRHPPLFIQKEGEISRYSPSPKNRRRG